MPLNDFLDSVPRTHLFRFHANLPAYRTCGITGFWFAVLTVLTAGLLTGRTLWVLLVMSAAAGLSFFVYGNVRRWLARRECIVLLEHVWFALAGMAGTLVALRQPVLPYLDCATPALALFLAFGRLGCTFVGCCHGVPSAVGTVYPKHFTGHGFEQKFTGIRLFPVAAIEMSLLLGIAASSFAALRLTPAGVPLAWFLIAYAFVRYMLEAVRGDARPHWLGLSVPRWMCAIQCTAALLWLALPGRWPWIAAAVPAALAMALMRYLRDPVRPLLRRSHLEELREIASGPVSPEPVSGKSSAGVCIGVSLAHPPRHLHVSLSAAGSLVAACRVAAAAFPSVDSHSAYLTASGVLHFLVNPQGSPHSGDLYLEVVRKLQSGVREPSADPQPSGPKQPWYFSQTAELAHVARV